LLPAIPPKNSDHKFEILSGKPGPTVRLNHRDLIFSK
jgi:hypothetical protein